MMTLYRQSKSKEFIDDPQVDAKTLRQTYRQLKVINMCTFGYWPTMRAIKYFLSRFGNSRKVKILDIGCGDGETLRRIDQYGRTRNLCLELTGIDVNDEAISSAIELTASNIKYVRGDILAHEDLEVYDVIINSLTMHHLNHQQIIKLMQWMSDHARMGWFISDLHRNVVPYYFIKNFVKLCRFNHLVCHDAPLSVARGFRRKEWIGLLTQTKLDLNSVRVFWYPNFRYGIRYENFL